MGSNSEDCFVPFQVVWGECECDMKIAPDVLLCSIPSLTGYYPRYRSIYWIVLTLCLKAKPSFSISVQFSKYFIMCLFC